MKKLNKDLFNTSNLTKDDLKAFVNRYKSNPIIFCEEIIGIRPDDNQRKIIMSIYERDYVSVGSGRG